MTPDQAASLLEHVTRQWVADPDTGRHKLRICFASPSADDLREGIARLADICHREFGVPVRSANVQR